MCDHFFLIKYFFLIVGDIQYSISLGVQHSDSAFVYMSHKVISMV